MVRRTLGRITGFDGSQFVGVLVFCGARSFVDSGCFVRVVGSPLRNANAAVERPLMDLKMSPMNIFKIVAVVAISMVVAPKVRRK